MRAFLLGLLTGLVLTIAAGIGGLIVVGHALAVEDPLAPSDVIVAVSGDADPS